MAADGREKGGGGRWSPTSAPLEQTIKDGTVKLLPTPMARTNGGTEVSSESREGGRMLEESVKLLPTPTAGMHNYEESVETWTARAARMQQKHNNGNGAGMPLPIALKLLPTPKANDGLRESPRRSGPGHGPTLEQLAALVLSGETSDLRSGVGSPPSDLRLSPWFVEWMMGAPEGWSDPDCPLSATEFRCKWASSQDATSSTASGSE
jgi:hypothetical protein